MYTVRYHDWKINTPFKHEPKRYMAKVYDESGSLIEAFCMKDKRRLKRLLRNFGYIN